VDDDAATLHRLTRHGSPADRDDVPLVVFRRLDPTNRPRPFKRYLGPQPVPLPRDLGGAGRRAVEVLSAAPTASPDGWWDAGRLARLLFLVNGVSRVNRSGSGATTYFRTAMSAGNLHPVEIYVVCGDLSGVAAGVHHYAPLEHGLTELRRGDHRAVVAEAAAAPEIADAGVTLAITGIPWRTGWKYGERGFRHLYWDAGTMIANLLAVEPLARVQMGFVDAHVARLVGVDGVAEFPLALVVLPGTQPEADRGAIDGGAFEPLDLAVAPMSRAPITFPLVTRAQHDGDLADPTAVERWRAAATASAKPALTGLDPPLRSPDEPIEAVILRRGSTRLMRREPAATDLFTWGLGVASRPLDADFVGSGATLLEHFVSLHDVEGIDPGVLRVRGDSIERRSNAQHRDFAAHLCLDQPLGGDSAFTVFHASAIEPILAALGSRGYRAPLLEAGIASGRLALAAFTLGYGATGLTFYDDEPWMMPQVGAPTEREENPCPTMSRTAQPLRRSGGRRTKSGLTRRSKCTHRTLVFVTSTKAST
jgi:SagB-type dehydrogenase family enzyme